VRIYGWCADMQGCGWYRIALPLLGLRQWGGHTVNVSQRLPFRRDLQVVEVLIAQRVCEPRQSRDWQRVCADPAGPATVYEIDDDLLEIDHSSEQAHAYYSDPATRANIITNAAAADLVTVSTEPLAEVMRRYNPRVAVLPNTIDHNLLQHERPRRDRLTIGWAGSPTHRMDFAEAAPALRQFLRRHPQVDMHFLGENYTKLVAGTDRLLEKQIRHTGWQVDIVDYYMAVDFDIGLAPLRPHVFNQRKSPVKALEYGVLGIPVVASDTGPYPGFVRHGQTGFLVRRPHEWAQYLHQLVVDEDLRNRMGAAGKELAAQWTIEARWRAWEETYMQVLERRRAA
jgi:glycosyltransferase involved in cell wall biosynthesis